MTQSDNYTGGGQIRMSDDWLDQLRELHEKDKAEQLAKTKPAPPVEIKRSQASDLLRQSQAHGLLRQVQKVLLNGQGALDIFDKAGNYDRVISLAWQGPISNARKPSPDDPSEYSYILVGVRQDKLWVNDKPLPAASPEALKPALLEACKNPKREKQPKLQLPDGKSK
jgi:hypothetical protein